MSYSLEELQAIAAAPDPERRADKWVLAAQRVDVVDNIDAILRTARDAGRPMFASEQRRHDDAHEVLSAIDRALIAVGRRSDESAQLRVRAGIGGGSPTTRPSRSFGEDIRAAALEVIEGRTAHAYVDYPEVRAISEAGSGGYGVPTSFGSPVSALAAKSVVLQLPGLRTDTVTVGDRVRYPRFNAVTVGGTAEGASLTAAATDIDAIDVIFQKFSTYETASNEWVEDTSFDALAALGDRMLKDLAAKVDIGLIEGAGASDVVGIFNQSGVSSTSVAGLPSDFDKVDEAIYQLELNDGTPGAWIMHPRSWRILKTIKTGIASDKTTLLADPAAEPRQLRGLPVFTTSAISLTSGAGAGSTVGLVDPSQIVVVTRRPARLEVSRDVAFATDSVAIRATTRIGLAVLDAPGAVSLLTDVRAS